METSFHESILRTRGKFDFDRPKTSSSDITDLNVAQPCKMPSVGSARDTMEQRRCSVQQRLPLPKNKSGHFVASALRSSNGTSAAGSCKVVRFHSELEQAISFFREDVPSAISTQVNEHESPFEWEASFSNLPAETPERLSLPVRVETAFMSSDNTELVGGVAVANIAFHKTVIARYTLDNWKTTSDAIATFNSGARQGNHRDEYDHFNFTIKMADKVNLESKVLLLAVKYCVNGQEYWDNNNAANFQIRFKKKPNLHVVSPLQRNMLPKSNKRSSASVSITPQSIPAAFENYAHATGVYESDKLKQLVNEQLSGSKLLGRLTGDEFGTGLEYSTPILLKRSLQHFSSRYNFDNSIFAAVRARTTPPAGCGSLDKTIILNQNRQSSKNAPYTALPSSISDPATPISAPLPRKAHQDLPLGIEKSSLDSETYNKVLEKYCFFGSTACRPQFSSRTLLPDIINIGYEYSIPALLT